MQSSIDIQAASTSVKISGIQTKHAHKTRHTHTHTQVLALRAPLEEVCLESITTKGRHYRIMKQKADRWSGVYEQQCKTMPTTILCLSCTVYTQAIIRWRLSVSRHTITLTSFWLIQVRGLYAEWLTSQPIKGCHFPILTLFIECLCQINNLERL